MRSPRTPLSSALRPGRILAVCLFAACFAVAAGDLRAGDSDDADKHLDYRRTYAEALREARIRNLPVFVSRHKDF